MIINGGSRSNGAFFGRHLMRADHNERVEVVEIRGLAAQTVPQAFREMQAVASGTRAKNYFYHANLNTRADEVLTPEQWAHAVDTLERALGLVDQPRFVVEHAKDGRTHRHVVWSRIDADSMTAISDALTYPKHEIAAREIEQAFGLEPVESVLVKDRDRQRPDRNPQDWESFRGQESKRDPKAIKAEVTALWLAADSGSAFAAALAEHGYILTRGDRRDFCLIDPAGDEHSLARRIAGVKAADIRARMNDIDPASLPSVAEGRALMRDRAGTGDAPVEPEPGSRNQPGGEQPPPEADHSQDLPPGDPTPAAEPPEEAVSLGNLVLWSRWTPWNQSPPPSAAEPTTELVAPAPAVPQGAERALADFFGEGRAGRSTAAPAVPPPSAVFQDGPPPASAATAEVQVRAAAAQFVIRDLDISGSTTPLPPHAEPLPRFEAAHDAAAAAEQVQAMAQLFVAAILQWGGLPDLVLQLVDDGLDLLERAALHLAELVEDVRDTVLTWRDHARAERDERNRDDELDFE